MERAVAAFPLREVRHGGRARVFSCFCRIWRSGLKNRPPGTEGAPTRTGAHLLQPMPNLERQPARQSRSPPLPAGHGRCATRTGARLLQPMPNRERQPARQSRPPPLPRRHGRCVNAHRRTLATTNAELGTTTSSAITPPTPPRRARKVRQRAPAHACSDEAELRTPKAPQAQAHVEKNGGET